MTRSLEDPTFAGRVESVETDLTYRVEFAGRSSETYHVRVFEYPELKRADAKLVFPGYTGHEPKIVEDIRHVTAVEGTELTLLCRLNKDVASAKLVDEARARRSSWPAMSLHPTRIRAALTLADPALSASSSSTPRAARTGRAGDRRQCDPEPPGDRGDDRSLPTMSRSRRSKS